MTTENKPTGFNGHAHFSLDDIAHMLPGPARLMHEIGTRWWKVYYAAKEKNWALADYECHEVEELFEICMVTRPKFQVHLEGFMNNDMKAIRAAINKKDWSAFEKVYHDSVTNANDYHKAANKPLLRWKLPSTPPPDMEMKPE